MAASAAGVTTTGSVSAILWYGTVYSRVLKNEGLVDLDWRIAHDLFIYATSYDNIAQNSNVMLNSEQPHHGITYAFLAAAPTGS